ncbi:MAG: hypothetical protein A2Y81_05590 [Nitrospirae bacterium RBG_13_43_8]|nr:MAG: hypothetical protein A2Y81_05590 [Nitrospirae bacterium RBG_13_43_8]
MAKIKADGTIRFYQQDALGSVIALTDETGAVKTTYSYDPFGNVTITGEASDNPFQYTGRENDGTGLYYYRARYYSPELQRFISEDPLLNPINPKILPSLTISDMTIHKYCYVANSPLIFADPMGLAVVPWPIPKCTPIGPSSKNCSIYKADCDKGDKTACLLYQACLNLGDNPWSNCVRCCLQEKYRECNECGCIIVDHFDCWMMCPPVFK